MCVFSSIYKKKKPLYGKLQVADLYTVFEWSCMLGRWCSSLTVVYAVFE